MLTNVSYFQELEWTNRYYNDYPVACWKRQVIYVIYSFLKIMPKPTRQNLEKSIWKKMEWKQSRHSHGAEGATRVAQRRDINLPHELIHLRDRVSQ